MEETDKKYCLDCEHCKLLFNEHLECEYQNDWFDDGDDEDSYVNCDDFEPVEQ